MSPALSIVIPAYEEAQRLGPTLERVFAYLDARGEPFEVIVVDDGSRDATSAVAAASGRVRVERLPENRGKGAAVRTGMLLARATWVLFSDADLSTPIEEVEKLLEAARTHGADVVIGTRAHAGSDIRIRQPVHREMMGRGFNVLVRALGLGAIKDTQCGFKLFTREASQAIFSKLDIDGFAFDVEVLLQAKEQGFRVVDVPVVWRHFDQSRVSPTTDAPRMFFDLLQLRARRLARRFRSR